MQQHERLSELLTLKSLYEVCDVSGLDTFEMKEVVWCSAVCVWPVVCSGGRRQSEPL